MTVFSVISEVTDTIRNQNKIKKMAEFVCPITVNRCGKDIIIQSNELVPSDLVILYEKMITDGDM